MSNMKRKSRVLALLLAAIMLLAVGCKDTPAESGTTSTGGQSSSGDSSSASSAEEETPPPENLKGYEFVVGSYIINTIAPEQGSTPQAEKMWARYQELEEEYGVTFRFINATADEFVNGVNTASAAGVKYADLLLSNAWWYKGFQDSGYLLPFNDLPYINMDDSKWLQTVREMTTEANGKTYGLEFSSWYSRLPMIGHMVFFNKEIFAKYNQPDPYELMEQGKWTWETFRQIAKATTVDIDGDRNNDIWGVTATDREFEFAVLHSNGCREVVKNSSTGLYELGFTNEKAYRAINFAKDIINTDKTFLNLFDIRKGGDWQQPMFNFIQGNVAMFVGSSVVAEWSDGLRQMEDSFGMVPFPQGVDNEGTDDWGGSLTGDTIVFCVPVGTTDKNCTAFLFDKMTEPLVGTNEDSWKDFARSTLFRGDQKAFDNYSMLLSNATYNYSPTYGMGNFELMRDAILSVTRDQAKTPAEALDAVAGGIQIAIDEKLNGITH